MNLEKLSEKYLKEVEKLKEFEKKNTELIGAYTAHKENVENIALKIKETAKELEQGLENSEIKINYIPVYRKFYDYRKFVENASSKENSVLVENHGLAINKEVFEKLAADGKISIPTVQSAFQEEKLSSRVDIKLKEQL
jgi:hypothetical protein